MAQDELTLELTIGMADDDMFFVAKDLIESYYGSVITDDGSFIFQHTRKSPFCLVAHMDTMRLYDDVDLEFDGRILRNRNGVLGADDRAGVFLIFQILRTCAVYGLPYPSILLTNFEELGLIGSREFIDSEWFNRIGCENHIDLLIGLDRAGYLEYSVDKSEQPSDVIKYIEDYGFKPVETMFRSDITILSEEFSVPAVNLSVGYYNQHRSNEFLDVQSLAETFNRVIMMIKNPLNGEQR